SLAEYFEIRIVIKRERSDRIGGLPEDDQPDAIILALANKLAHHLLHSIHATRALAVGHEKVGGLQRPRNIEREHQITCRLDFLYRRLDELRTRQRENYKPPADRCQDFPHPVCLRYHRSWLR